MKNITRIFFISILICNSFCEKIQAQMVLEWQQCFGGTSGEQPSSLKQTPDGGYILCGHAGINSGDVSGIHGSNDIWLVKTDQWGTLQWQKCLGGTSWEYGESINLTPDNGFIITGSTNSNNGDVSGNHGMSDTWILKTDSVGNILWQHCYGGTKNESGNSVIVTNDGGYVVAGRTGSSNNGNVSGYHASTDFWLFKVDGGGNLLWQKCLGGSLYESAFAIKQTPDSGFVVAGYSRSWDFDILGWLGEEDIWMVKTDTVGNIQWVRTYGGSEFERAYSLITTSDGGYAIAGYTTSFSLPSYHYVKDVFIIKADAMGDVVWQKCYGGSSYEEAKVIVETASGNFIVGGYSGSTDGDAVGNFYAGGWIFEIDAQGNLLWQKTVGGSGSTTIMDLVINTDGGITMLCSTNCNDGDVSGNHSAYSDFWLVKLSIKYNLIYGKTFLDMNSNGIFDMGEQPVKNLKVIENATGRFDFSNDSGEYILVVTDTGNFNYNPVSIPYYTSIPSSNSSYFNILYDTDSLKDFAIQPVGVFNDLCISITPMGNFRAGMTAYYSINYSNPGNTILNPTVIFYPDADLTFSSATPVPTTIAPDSLVWNFGPLQPFESGSINVSVFVNPVAPIGTLINSGVVIEPIAGDANPICNQHYWEILTTGSFDPNDILVSRDTLLDSETAAPPFLEYVIRFQNTGNDTAFVVTIDNNISPDLDLSTFEVISSSHAMDISFLPHARLMKYSFDNILLPDSAVDEAGSHGFVHYKIKPVNTLIVGDSVLNKANIFFDFNLPVITNTAVTEVVMPTGINEPSVAESLVKIYPNPAYDKLNINIGKLKNNVGSIVIADLPGRSIREIRNYEMNEAVMAIDIANLPAGIYFIRIETASYSQSMKFIKL